MSPELPALIGGASSSFVDDANSPIQLAGLYQKLAECAMYLACLLAPEGPKRPPPPQPMLPPRSAPIEPGSPKKDGGT
jgi:hypothetical protein